MPVEVMWANAEKTIVLYNFSAVWTWDEFYPVFDTALKMERSVAHRVDVILDISSCISVPSNTISHVRQISSRQPPNLGLSVFITRNQFIIALAQIAMKLYPPVARDYRIVASKEAALAMVEEAQHKAAMPEMM